METTLWLYTVNEYDDEANENKIRYGITYGDSYGDAAERVVKYHGADYCDDVTIVPMPCDCALMTDEMYTYFKYGRVF